MAKGSFSNVANMMSVIPGDDDADSAIAELLAIRDGEKNITTKASNEVAETPTKCIR